MLSYPDAKKIALNYIDALKQYDELEKDARIIVSRMREIQHEFIQQFVTNKTPLRQDRGCLTSMDYSIAEDKLTLHFEEYVCGDTDYYEQTFPLSWIDNPDWEAMYLDQLKEAREYSLVINKQKEDEKKQKEKDGRRALFLSLKQEFENE